MVILLTVVHIIVCFFLVVIVLLQSGKAADLAGAFGGMGSQTAFGPRGAATFLSKATTGAAVLFMITSITLSIIATRRGGVGSSVLDTQKAGAPAKGPVQPAKTPPLQPGQPVDIKIMPPTTEQKGGAAPPSQPAGQHSPAPAHSAPAPGAPAGKK
ncbi:MAG: preprotein translocase subunit SecG [Acidobacteria bacterium]|nr:preprotein translocase subunit SecG [Acidobacteriota bacterium]